MIDLSENFWDGRYKTKETGWDLGEISPPLRAYFDQLKNKNLKILIPGGGNSYEAEYLYHKGFKNVYVVDLSVTALSNITRRVPSFPSSHLIHMNFFELQLLFDIIIEQTFFCAIHPKLRNEYVSKASQLLNNDGKIVGLLFNDNFTNNGPPFGGHKHDYLRYFESHFNVLKMETAYNSHPKRAGRELFFKVQKKI